MARLRAHVRSDSDPFDIISAPPADETNERRTTRLRAEAEAKRVSDAIDVTLVLEKTELKRRQKSSVKILLLGQSESGKSTTLKNFRLKYAREVWDAERTSWRGVCQLNLVRSINTILEEISDLMHERPPSRSRTNGSTVQSPLVFTEKHVLLKMRLGPLRGIQSDLEGRFGAAAKEGGEWNSYVRTGVKDKGRTRSPVSPLRSSQDFVVKSWQEAFSDGHGTPHSAGITQDATEVIAGCMEYMEALFMDDVVQEMLSRTTDLLEPSAAFFLWDIHRIATRDYQPSDNDIIYARLRTCGVQEYRLVLDANARETLNRQEEMVIYDVGGSRGSRRAWIPYFQNVHALIVLIPVSAFNQQLKEDRRVNRLADSFMLWTAVCSSKLLADSTLILLLNKYDLLEEKIQSGVQVKQFLTSYGDRANEAPVVVRYIRQKLKDVLARSPVSPKRPFFPYITSVVDIRATEVTIQSIQEGIVASNLKAFNML